MVFWQSINLISLVNFCNDIINDFEIWITIRVDYDLELDSVFLGEIGFNAANVVTAATVVAPEELVQVSS